jgi:uncharacterized membrane protein YgdD (TMEM256/DUF423 family)
MQKTILLFATISGALAVGIGAFGAHKFQKILEANNRIDTFDTGVKYHFYHTLALLFLGLYMNFTKDNSYLNISAFGFMLGLIIFSGSLYTLSLTNITKLGAITPIGGLGFIIGWVALAMNIGKNQF